MALLTLPWWPLSPWLSPAAAWFIFFNAVVGAITVMSSSSSGSSAQAPPSPRRLCRSGSSSSSEHLDRLRSFSVFSVHPAAGGVTAAALPLDDAGGSDASSDSHCCYCRSRSRQVDVAPDARAQLMRGPMPVDKGAATGGATATSAPVAAMVEAEDHVPAPAPAAPADPEDTAEAEAVLQDDSIGLDEAYALAQRHRAAQPLPPPAATTTPTASPAQRTKKKPAAKVAEAGVRRRAQGCGGAAAGVEALLEGKAELNARAELFIRQFREDLKLQRLNSILRHTQALGSPTAAAAR
ncbi:hypothetical protein BS78_07G128100 [Paspalum vaginatum]|nr:hypothetical protein BS78_07G128100 [Paspalum vaginatum]